MIYVVPGVLNLFLREGRHYRLYGFHHFLGALSAASANSGFFNLLLGDSVLIDKFLRFFGVKLARRPRPAPTSASKVADQLQFVLTHSVMNAVRAFAFVN